MCGDRLTRQYSVGPRFAEAVETAEQLRRRNVSAMIGQMSPLSANNRDMQVSEYSQALAAMSSLNLNCAIVTFLASSESLMARPMREAVESILYEAVRAGTVLFIDMPADRITNPSIECLTRLSRTPGCAGHVGVTLYPDLYRTHYDLQRLAEEPILVRLSTHQYLEAVREISTSPKEARANFMDVVAHAFNCCESPIAFQTNDSRLVGDIIRYLKKKAIPAGACEFHVTLGIRPELEEQLAKDGWRVRVFLPFGDSVYSYLIRAFLHNFGSAV